MWDEKLVQLEIEKANKLREDAYASDNEIERLHLMSNALVIYSRMVLVLPKGNTKDELNTIVKKELPLAEQLYANVIAIRGPPPPPPPPPLHLILFDMAIGTILMLRYYFWLVIHSYFRGMDY